MIARRAVYLAIFFKTIRQLSLIQFPSNVVCGLVRTQSPIVFIDILGNTKHEWASRAFVFSLPWHMELVVRTI
jgi:hypothetical protein